MSPDMHVRSLKSFLGDRRTMENLLTVSRNRIGTDSLLHLTGQEMRRRAWGAQDMREETDGSRAPGCSVSVPVITTHAVGPRTLRRALRPLGIDGHRFHSRPPQDWQGPRIALRWGTWDGTGPTSLLADL